MNGQLEKLTSQFSDKAAELEEKLNDIQREINLAEKAAYQRAVKMIMSAQAIDWQGKTILVKVPADQIEQTVDNLNGLYRELNCKLIVVSDEMELKDLHELELKSLGLKRIE